MANAEVFDSFFRRADLDRDGRISGGEAVGFFQGSGLPQATLAKIWQFSDQSRAGFLSRQEFYNALKLVTVAQSGRDLTPELVKAALNGPAASQIPPPRINAPTPSPTSFAQTPPPVQTPATAQQGSYGQQFPASGFNAAAGPGVGQARPGVTQARPSLGGLMGASSLPPGGQGMNFSTGMGLPTGPGFQPTAAPSGLPRPTAPSGMLAPAASLPTATSTPGFQAPAGTGGLKVGPGSFSSGDLASLYAQATPTRPAGAGPPSKSRSSPELQAFGESFRSNPVGPTSLAPTDLPSSFNLDAKPSGVAQTQGLGSGFGPRPLSGPPGTPPWPRMSPNDVQRYTRVFSKVDTDHDGKITGEQARQLFLGWQLPREVLKQVWNLSDQDGDSMLSVREFCTALYLMERFREGRPLPPSLPPGIHLDDPRGPEGPMPAAQRPGYGGPAWQHQGNMQHVGPGSAPPPSSAPIRPTLLTTPAGQQHLQTLTSTGSSGAEPPKDAFDQFNFLNKKKQPDRQAPSSGPASNAMPVGNAMPAPTATSRGLDNLVNRVNVDRKLMDHREKSAYYRSKLQEIVLFKSRCDNKLSEITERAAGDKREVDSLAKKYDEKFKGAAEVNAQLAVENAKLREVQEKKMELLDALFKMEHGGDPNALLQKRADHIATDLDKLKIALRDRGRILGVEVKQRIPKEMPFGWTQNLQEKATEWHDWDELMDRDFTVVQNLTDENTSEEKPSAAATWGKDEESSPKNESVSENNAIVEKEVSSSPEPGLTDTSSQNPSETSIKNETEVSGNDASSSKPTSDGNGVPSSVSTTKTSERYANVRESHESNSDLFNGPTAASSPTSSSEVGRGSSTPDAFGGIRTSWGFGSNEDDADSGSRASWGLQSNPPSTQASLDVTDSRASRFGKSTSSFGQGGSFDFGSPRTSSIDGTSSPARAFERNGTNQSQDFDSFGAFASLATSKDSNKTSLFGGAFSPKASSTPSLFGDSPKASNNSFLRFDSFGPGSPVAPPRPSGASEDRPSNAFSRFDSFSSVQTDGARGGGFHSDDESDIFSASGPFSAKQSNVSDAWKAF